MNARRRVAANAVECGHAFCLRAPGFRLEPSSRLIAVVPSALLAAACGPDASPTTPTGPPPPGPGAGPVALLSIVIDSLGSEEAITALSEVRLDAAASTGSGTLTYRLDFGDGTSATAATARHAYNTPGSGISSAAVIPGRRDYAVQWMASKRASGTVVSIGRCVG